MKHTHDSVCQIYSINQTDNMEIVIHGHYSLETSCCDVL